MIKLKYGDLIAFRPTSKTGELIRAIDSRGFGDYSHWAFFWGYKDGAPLFLESVEGRGVQVNMLEEWRNTFDIYRPIDLKPRPVREMLLLVGAKYDYNRIWAILMNRLFGKKLYADSPTQPICTEYVNYGYKYKIVPAGTATPFTLENSDKLQCIYKSNQ